MYLAIRSLSWFFPVVTHSDERRPRDSTTALVKSCAWGPEIPSHSGGMSMDRAERTLNEVFGLDAFRPGQADVVAAMLAGRDVLSVAPTGSGKSISYWVPAVVDGGLTLVVSPLIALMKDQVDRLTARGVAATFVNSSVEPFEQRERLRRALAGEYRLRFLAPERLARPGLRVGLATL